MDEPLEALRRILRDRAAPEASVVAAAKALLDAEAGAVVGKPTSVAQVEALSTAQLHALIGRLDPLATRLPVDPEPAPAQG